MKILKLCTSDELAPGIPDGQRAYQVAERIIQEATGENVETQLQVIWPSPRLPERVTRWMSKYEPNLVLLVVSPFWMTFESTPLKLQRRFGTAGRLLGQTGARLGGSTRISGSRPVMAVRRLLLSTLGGAYYFEPEEIVDLVDACASRVLADESAGLVVRAPLASLGHHGNGASLRRAMERRTRTATLLRRVCDQRHVTFVDRAPSETDEKERAKFNTDLVHTNVEAHRRRGEREGAALIEAWNRLQGDEPKR